MAFTPRLAAIAGAAYARTLGAFRGQTKALVLLFALWMFFGFFTDLVGAIRPGGRLEFAADFVEDGGEMAVLSLWYAINQWRVMRSAGALARRRQLDAE